MLIFFKLISIKKFRNGKGYNERNVLIKRIKKKKNLLGKEEIKSLNNGGAITLYNLENCWVEDNESNEDNTENCSLSFNFEYHWHNLLVCSPMGSSSPASSSSNGTTTTFSTLSSLLSFSFCFFLSIILYFFKKRKEKNEEKESFYNYKLLFQVVRLASDFFFFFFSFAFNLFIIFPRNLPKWVHSSPIKNEKEIKSSHNKNKNENLISFERWKHESSNQIRNF